MKRILSIFKELHDMFGTSARILHCPSEGAFRRKCDLAAYKKRITMKCGLM